MIGNHFNAKMGDDPIFGRTQPPVLGSEDKRIVEATLVRRFINRLLDADPNAKIIVLGDLNDFWCSPPLKTLVTGLTPDRDLLDLTTTLDANERYSYVFEGNSQDLDHMLISPGLAGPLVSDSYDVVHVNAELGDQASDHDPQVARFLLLAA